MARPRILKYGGGEVVCRNIPPEVADQVEALLKNPQQIMIPAGTIISDLPLQPGSIVSFPEPVAAPKLLPMNMTAVGNFKAKNGEWSAYAVNFNSSGQCKIVEEIECGAFKNEAIFNFKKLADKYELV